MMTGTYLWGRAASSSLMSWHGGTDSTPHMLGRLTLQHTVHASCQEDDAE